MTSFMDFMSSQTNAMLRNGIRAARISELEIAQARQELSALIACQLTGSKSFLTLNKPLF